ncbi:TPA: RluA family pseudouridine synthase [Staphylococcus aureus]
MKFKYHISQQETVKTFLARHDFSKKTVSAIKNNGALIVNDEPVTVRKQLMTNDILEIHLPREIPSVNLIPYARKLEVLYEDAFIIIVTKPNNQNCTPSREHPHESLIEQVLYHCQEHGENINPHIVTRLDRNTTGIIEANIRRSKDRIITREVASDGKYAKTSYEVINQNDKYSLCKVHLHTGRTHQIRVHFQHIGHPIVGDSLYDGFHDKIHGQVLQCTQIYFVHPINKNNIYITIDYKQLLKLFNQL